MCEGRYSSDRSTGPAEIGLGASRAIAASITGETQDRDRVECDMVKGLAFVSVHMCLASPRSRFQCSVRRRGGRRAFRWEGDGQESGWQMLCEGDGKHHKEWMGGRSDHKGDLSSAVRVLDETDSHETHHLVVVRRRELLGCCTIEGL